MVFPQVFSWLADETSLCDVCKSVQSFSWELSLKAFSQLTFNRFGALQTAFPTAAALSSPMILVAAVTGTSRPQAMPQLTTCPSTWR